ncbi:MAG: DNA polymerase III subunit epsilon, partial [Stenotrophobium sp.]
QKASLDALCKRYSVDNSNRDLHGALLDARLLADVYLAMTGGQSSLILNPEAAGGAPRQSRLAELLPPRYKSLRVTSASEDERAAHLARLKAIARKSGKLFWQDELPADEQPAAKS